MFIKKSIVQAVLEIRIAEIGNPHWNMKDRIGFINVSAIKPCMEGESTLTGIGQVVVKTRPTG